MKKKSTKGVMDGVPLTQEGVCQVLAADCGSVFFGQIQIYDPLTLYLKRGMIFEILLNSYFK